MAYRLPKLREARESRYLSIRELAQRAGLSPATVVNLESGATQAQPRTVRKLSAALDMSPGDLGAELVQEQAESR
jgi:transcriptional regulator with XRE-family HTH domain